VAPISRYNEEEDDGEEGLHKQASRDLEKGQPS
jgi:hypothetical protein